MTADRLRPPRWAAAPRRSLHPLGGAVHGVTPRHEVHPRRHVRRAPRGPSSVLLITQPGPSRALDVRTRLRTALPLASEERRGPTDGRPGGRADAWHTRPAHPPGTPARHTRPAPPSGSRPPAGRAGPVPPPPHSLSGAGLAGATSSQVASPYAYNLHFPDPLKKSVVFPHELFTICPPSLEKCLFTFFYWIFLL